MKKIFFSILLIAVLIGIASNIYASSNYDEAEVLYFQEDGRIFDLYEGENYFKIYVDETKDIYFEIDLVTGSDAYYVELYSEDGGLIMGDYTKYASKFYLASKNSSPGWYYIMIHSLGDSGFFTYKAESFYSSYGVNEPNNWRSFATQLEIDVSIIINDDLGSDDIYGNDIDIYAYTASEPCMLTVKMEEYDQCDYDIYIGDLLLNSTDYIIKPIKTLDIDSEYSFNITHGTCYFVIRGGIGDYEFWIERSEYQSTPVFYNVSPLKNDKYCEFDDINPQISVIGDGNVYVSCLFVKNGNAYSLEDKYISVNNKTFTSCNFPIIDADAVPDTFKRNQNTIQFVVSNTTGAKTSYSRVSQIKYDNQPPEYKDIDINANVDSIEINVLGAYDSICLAERPYRYRVYLKNSSVPEYSDWSSASYFSSGLEDSMLVPGIYIVEIQIRDSIAEKYQNDNKDLSNHILTITEEITID